jgi:2-hydroxy-6-oxonona-2,4-dienedioate hydrolase
VAARIINAQTSEENLPLNLTRRTVLSSAALGAGAALLGVGLAAGSYVEAVAAARQRITGRSQLVRTRHGMLEYAVAGTGKPFLMVHGTGGGFDQGLRFTVELLERNIQVIAPSRFGYLRSDFPPDPSPQNQADAFVELLDHLHIERIALAGGSAGALPAAHFALRHPDRCDKLVLLVPAANLDEKDPVAFTPLQRFLVSKLLTSDAWFYAALKLAPESLIGTLLATDPALLHTVSPAEAARARHVLHDLMPISLRARGMALDGHMAGQPANFSFADLAVPTLIISAEDDRFGTAATARAIAAAVPSSKLVIYPTGGHLMLGHDADVATEIIRFLG